MPLELSDTAYSDFIEYRSKVKKLSGMFLIAIFCIIGALGVLYFIFLRRLELFQGTWFSFALTHIKDEVFSNSAIGLFYVTFFGGLFFLFTPIDVFFIAAINTGKFSPLHCTLMFLGLLFSYSLNYVIGLRFSTLSKKLVSPKKFYKTKVIVNKFGKLAILFFNIIGFGSQQLTFVLGVFRYNRTRLLILAVIGQIIHYSLIAVVLIWIIG